MTPSVAEAVVVFARTPELGRVKTRLAAAYGDDAALRLHRAFLADSLAAARATGASVVLAHTPGESFAEQLLADHAIVQRGEGFAARFDAALSDAHALLGDETRYVVIGVDTPHLGPLALRAALNALKRASTALGAGRREGFYLLGFRGSPVPVASAIGRPDEARAVAALLESAGRPPAALPLWDDIDLPEDVERLARHLRIATGWRPERTLSALDGLGLLH